MSKFYLFCFAILYCTALPIRAQTSVDTEGYRTQGAAALQVLKSAPAPTMKAKNLIIFIGDGMGISTITAARIFAGQTANQDGESFQTAMDSLPYAAIVKTYSHDTQVPDSAATATAIFAGIKTHNGMIGIGPEAALNDCASGKNHHLTSLVGLAQAQGIGSGIVTTTAITDATPAATYAQTVQRNWESDTDMPQSAKAMGCLDVARQLIGGAVGSQFDVIMGGGRAAFRPKSMRDPEYADQLGMRSDGRDLIATWQEANPKGAYVWNRTQFLAFDPTQHKRVLGLFAPSDMQFEADREKDPAGEPSLAEMTETAIKILSENSKGYILLIEGGRIDHGHHAGNAFHALSDAKALDEAVATALRMTNPKETLIAVTSDHSHTLTISGYAKRGNPILGVVTNERGEPLLAKDGKGFTTLSYANGPGANPTHERTDPVAMNTSAPEYLQPSHVPLSSETHAGEDVAVRASGPGAHLFRGTIEQNTIFYILREALLGADPK